MLSGNRNFEGRVSPDVRANFLASPPLVVAYALKGTVTEDMVETPIGQDQDGADVFLKDIWPTNQEVADTMAANIDRGMFEARYGDVYRRRRQVARDRGRRRRTPTPGARDRPTSTTRPISRA